MQNLGIITPQLNAYGGSEIFLLECIARWQARVPKITVYTPNIDFGLLCEFGIDPERVDIHILPEPPTKQKGQHSLLQRMLLQPRLWEDRIGRHDVTFQYLFPTHLVRCGASVWFAAEPFRAAYDLRDLLSSGGEKESLEVHLYPKLHYETVKTAEFDLLLSLLEEFETHASFDALATNSIATARYLETVYEQSPDRVVYPGIRRWPESHRPSFTNKQVLSVGRLWDHKQVHLQIRAMQHVPEGRLVIVGVGPEESALRALAKELGLEERVDFEGSVSSERLAELYASSSCCVYTPHLEPFGMVPLEAAAAGLPVVGTRGGGFAEILDETSSILVPANPETIGEALTTTLEDPDLARRMGERGRAQAHPHTWDRTAEELYALLEQTAVEHSYGSTQHPDDTGEPPRVGAHYYPWYSAEDPSEHWNENRKFANVSDPPPAGPYTSTDEATLRRHLDEARRARLDFFTINWQVGPDGLNPTELEATRKLFDLVERKDYPIALSVMLSTATDDVARLFEAVQVLHDDFIPRGAYQRVADDPLVWYFTSGEFLSLFWRNASELREMHGDARLIASGPIPYNRYLPAPLRRFFSGWSLYSPLEVGPERIRPTLWRSNYESFFDDREMDSPRRLRTFSICPGYDDHALVSEKRARTAAIPRRGTRTFEEMQQCVLELRRTPDLVVVTSFNEFHENTHVEPSEAHGDRFLESLARFQSRLHQKARDEKRDSLRGDLPAAPSGTPSRLTPQG